MNTNLQDDSTRNIISEKLKLIPLSTLIVTWAAFKELSNEIKVLKLQISELCCYHTPATNFIFSDGTRISFPWIGEINVQNMVDSELYDPNTETWKNIVSIEFGQEISGIGDNTFRNCITLSNLMIPNSISSIGENAFLGCSELSLIFLDRTEYEISGLENYSWGVDPEHIRSSIETYVIRFNSNGGEGTMQDLTANVGQEIALLPNAFSYSNHEFLGWSTEPNGEVVYLNEDSVIDIASSGETIVLYAKWLRIISPESILTFDNGTMSSYNWSGTIDRDTMIAEGLYNSGHWKNIVSAEIGLDVNSIGSWAFHQCGSLKSITIQNSVSSIGDFAFTGCINLSSIINSDLIKNIGTAAFYDCSSLTEIKIPSSIISIGEVAFGNCNSLSSVNFKNKTRAEIEELPNYSWGIDPNYIYPQE